MALSCAKAGECGRDDAGRSEHPPGFLQALHGGQHFRRGCGADAKGSVLTFFRSTCDLFPPLTMVIVYAQLAVAEGKQYLQPTGVAKQEKQSPNVEWHSHSHEPLRRAGEIKRRRKTCSNALFAPIASE